MESFNGEVFGKNIRQFIEASGLTQDEVAYIINVSKETLRNILDNKFDPRGTTLIHILDFFGLDKKATMEMVDVPIFYREKLKKRHAKNESIRPHFEKAPQVPFALEYYLIPSFKLKVPQEIGDIERFFASYGWDFTTSEISDAIRRNKQRLGIRTRKRQHSNRGYEYYVE